MQYFFYLINNIILAQHLLIYAADEAAVAYKNVKVTSHVIEIK
jgi:hypothetical protein